MNVDNPLSREFLLRYPAEAARVLEQVPVEHVAALFTELPPALMATVTGPMLPGIAASCLDMMSPESAAKLVAELPASSAARIFRLLPMAKRDGISTHLADKTRSQIHHYLMFSKESAGALLNSKIDMLPWNITVAEAIRRIERLDHSSSCDIHIIDDAHHLVGSIDLGRLLISDHHIRLQDIMNRKTQPISVHAPVETLLSHPGWTTRRRLPVVERDNTLAGALDYSHLLDSLGETATVKSRDPLENILSLASLYWLTLAQILDGILSIARPEKGGRQ